MTTVRKQRELRVAISSDRSQAELFIPSDLPRAHLTAEICQALLRAEGVELTPEVRQAVAQLIQNPPVEGEDARVVLAEAQPPQHGEHGRVVWSIDQQHAEENASQSHYERSAFIMAKPGMVIGQIIEPTAGMDGRDVTGRCIPARAGKPVTLKLDETILRDGAGRLIAQAEGALVRTAERATIRQVLEVKDYVDFSTGNIDFAGSVVVGKGIRDLFVVKAAGNIDVGGLIEAATIECEGDLLARGGIAGRGRGSVNVGGNLTARYMDQVSGEIRGHLTFDREAINCQLVVHGGIKTPNGLLIGGRVTVVGPVHVGTVGSPAGVATELILGSVPSLEPLAVNLRQLIVQLASKRDDLLEEQRKLTLNTRPTAFEKERQTEILFEMQNVNQRLCKGQAALDALEQRINEERTVELTAGRCIHAGAILSIGEVSFRLTTDLKGPVKVLREGGDVVYRHASGSGLLAQVSEVRSRQF